MKRWWNREKTEEINEEYLQMKQKEFRCYEANIYILNRAALKLQHWFFSKLHPDDVPKKKSLNTQGSQATKKQRATNMKNGKENYCRQGKVQNLAKVGSEQAILDACWSGTAVGNKLRNKILQRMEHVKKIKQLQDPITKRAKTPNRVAPHMKNRKKRDMTKLIIMVQEAESKIPIPDAVTCKQQLVTNKIRPSARSITPRKEFSPFDYKVAPFDESQVNCTYISNRPSINPVTSPKEEDSSLQAYIDQEVSSQKKSQPLQRDTATYNTLREQLRKITMELEQEKLIPGGESQNSTRKQRRTREDRKKKNKKMISDISALTNYNTNTTHEEPLLCVTQEIPKTDTSVISPKEKPSLPVVKKPLVRNNTKKVLDKSITKENTKAAPKPKEKPAPAVKKDTNAKKHIARKYLGELYTKIMFHVKEIEREKKVAVPPKKPKRTLEKSATCRQELVKKAGTNKPNLAHKSKANAQGKK